jgi:hypothetical protein
MVTNTNNVFKSFDISAICDRIFSQTSFCVCKPPFGIFKNQFVCADTLFVFANTPSAYAKPLLRMQTPCLRAQTTLLRKQKDQNCLQINPLLIPDP